MYVTMFYILYALKLKYPPPQHTHTHTHTKITQFRLFVGGGGEADGYTKKKKTQ